MDLVAIAKILQKRLPEGILVKVFSNKGSLKVVLEAVKAPTPSIVKLLRIDELSSSNLLSNISLTIKVYGCQSNVFEADWVERISLDSSDNTENSTPALAFEEGRFAHQTSRKNEIGNAHYEQILDECTQSAHEAFQRATYYYKQFAQQLKSFENEINLIVTTLTKNNHSKNFSCSEVLEEIRTQLHEEISINLNKLEESLRTREQHLSEFTVVLFGRTKAGKSTLREALTKGDGSTIGKGLQRTTRDIKEYSWNGLRLIDTPGIEAYKGEEDKQKAQEIAHESDMVIFLTSDDSIQPDEFVQMAWIQDINKYFFIVLNTKYIERNIEDPKRLKRFIQKLKNEVFDEQRLSEHKNHIRSHIENYKGCEEIDIVCIHAHAAFLSISPEYADYADELWQRSRVNAIYQKVISEIKLNGIKRRWDSMFDEVFRHTNKLISYLESQHNLLEAQLNFLHENKRSLEHAFSMQTKDSKKKIERACMEEFRRIKQWIPGFIEDYLGKDNAQPEYKKRMEKEKKQIEASMKETFDEILDELISTVSEFQRQYQYDSDNIKISLSDFREYKGTDFGSFLKWTSVGLGVLSGVAFILTSFAAANFWNPVGWVATGASVVVGLFSSHVQRKEAKAWHQVKQDVRKTLLKNIDEAEKKTCELYIQLFTKKIADKAKNEVIGQTQNYIDAITQINQKIKNFAAELRNSNNKMDREKKDK